MTNFSYQKMPNKTTQIKSGYFQTLTMWTRHDQKSRQPTGLERDISVLVLPVLFLTSW